jgi:flagellar motor switch protein FliN/FliY
MNRDGAQRWLCEQFSSLLVTIFETMAGERPEMQWEDVSSAPTDATLRWRQPFSGVDGAVWVTAAEADWTTAGGHVLRGAGIQDSDAASLKSTFLEITGQALSRLALALSARLGREIRQAEGEEVTAPPGEAVWMSVHLNFGETMVSLVIGFETALQAALSGNARSDSESDPSELDPSESSLGAVQQVGALLGNSKTFELLLEVELPISVSFGRAQVPLKDVLKLTTGSIVELNRSVTDPVEVIVNNCVIARGEVVVVDGNFGVRIQQVISRQERLRTLS